MTSAHRPESGHYRADVDGIRALAVTAVVVFHAFPGILPSGFVGVDIFFVISGFLISRIIFESLEKQKFSLLDFYARRVRRIFPALSVTLICCLLAGWVLLLPNDYAVLGKHVLAGATFVSNIVLYQETGYFDQASVIKPLLHLWSLGIEEQFYILYPLILAALWKARKATGWLIVTLIFTSFVFSIYLLNTDNSAAFYSSLSRFWELSTGGLLALQQFKTASSQTSCCDNVFMRHWASFLGLGAVLVAVTLLSNHALFPGYWALLPVVGTALLLWSGPKAFINRHIFSNRILVWVGLISYPLYLWHWPLLTFARIDTGEPLSRTIRLLLLVLSVVLAWLTYRFIELPFRRRSPSKAQLLVLVSMMTMTGLIGLGVYLAGGIASRMPNFIQQLSALKFDEAKLTRVGTCFLLLGQPSSDFGGCKDDTVPERKTLLLIGDSHSSHLYPGLIDRFGQSVNVIQRTAGGCPPLFGRQTDSISSFCKDINHYTQRLILNTHPEIVVLAANWIFYDLTELSDTVRWLKEEGIKKVFIIGPVPQWRDGLLKQLYQHYRQTDEQNAPQTMSLGLNPLVAKVDDEIERIVVSANAKYISPHRLLCTPLGCLTRYGDSLETVMTWDYGHLTAGASEFLVLKFPSLADE